MSKHVTLPVKPEGIESVSFQWFNHGEQQKYPAIQLDKIILFPNFLGYDLADKAKQAYCDYGYSISPGNIVKLNKCGVPEGWTPESG